MVDGWVCTGKGGQTKVRKLEAIDKEDPDGLVELCLESVQNGHSVLVFCATKMACQNAAKFIASHKRCVIPKRQKLAGFRHDYLFLLASEV